MRPSERAQLFVKGFEQLRLTGYLPTPNDVPTIGWGHTAGVHVGEGWTLAEAQKAWEADVELFSEGLDRLLGGAPTTQGQYDALFSLAYNIGLTNLKNSTLLRLHKAHDYTNAANQFLRWNKQRGKVLAGLTKRRRAERLMYIS